MEPTDLKREFGDWVRYIRKIKNDLTQDELAEKIGVNKQTISRYECGLRQPRQKIINKITDYGGVPFDVYLTEQKIPYETRSDREKKALERVKEIFQSKDNEAIEALEANIGLVHSVVRRSKKGNEGKGGIEK